MSKRKISVCQQTWALFQKNVLKKWRMKREFLMEWINSLLLLLFLYLYPNGHQVTDFSSLPTMDLGRVDSFTTSKFLIAYSPVTSTTQQIMKKVADVSFMTGEKEVLGLSDEESIKEVTANHPDEVIRVIFSDTYSYHMKFLLGQRIPIRKEHRDHAAPCFETFEDTDCLVSKFWKSGFMALQAAINAAIIEVKHEILRVFCFCTRLSWGLLYAGFVFIMALFLALVIKSVQFFVLSSFAVVFTLFLFYGLSMLLHLDYDLNSNAPPDPAGGSNLIIITNFMLAFDTVLYLVLMMYLEKILPNERGLRHSPLFFLKPSFWSQQRVPDPVVLEDEIDSDLSSNDSFEPMPPEFHGKESIRIRNVTKEYKGKPDKIEALKDLTLDIYEGQITAILGHSGAGKSTLLNILSGLSVSTKGSVTIYNNKLSEMSDLENIVSITGVCPQSNVHFDFLTVRENLRLFAKIRGIPSQEVKKEVQKVLLELEMKNIQNVLVQNLSGGQKRKLTFGIAILGDSQIFLLDEPTAGLDPFSRHQVWSLLKERKADRVVLFSTQFMDEADILAGNGWMLRDLRTLNEICVRENITSLVKQHIPEAKLSAESEGKLVYMLPLETTYRFPELYKDLDSCPGLGIENYGVSMTTLNEVFLKLEGKSTTDEPETDILGEGQEDRVEDTERLIEMEQIFSSLTEMKKTIDGVALWGQQICAIAKVRLLKLKHERKALLSLLLILAVGFFPLLLEYILVKIHQNSYTWELSPHSYFLAPGQQPQDPLTQLLIINKTGASIEDFIHSVEHQNIALEVDASGARDGVDNPSYNGAITVSGSRKNYSFSFACNAKRLNCFPVLLDIVSNGLLRMVKPSARIQTDRSTYLEGSQFEYLGHTMFWLVLASSCPPYIAMSSVSDYKIKAWSQLRISGLFPSAYWLGQALVDAPLYCLVFIFMYLMDYLFSFQETVFTVINRIIIGKEMGHGIFEINHLDLETRNEIKSMYCVIFLIPQATLVGCLFLSFHLLIFRIFNEEPKSSEPFLVFLIPFLHVFIFLFTLRCLEWKFGKKSMRKDPFFRISPRSNDVCQNPEEPEGEDEDVHMERVRTASALSSTNFDERPVIVASCLRKEYAGKRKRCFSKKKPKVATRNISFCVRKGEILGLLGHNGAGKSTSIRMITGDTKSTAGQVLLKGTREGDTLGFLGYCPQENVLWPNLTVKEHLEVFAAVKGLNKSDTAVTIMRLVDALKLRDQLKSPVKTLSEGLKRKLCFVLSILGNPSVVFLELSKEQELDGFEEELDSSVKWKLLPQEEA
uniref:ATP-binding cassette, sub-family A member 8b n=1 Tax=Nannospalax galili TaxID=1026970 RepID=A0A8C6QUZ7_NANGA